MLSNNTRSNITLSKNRHRFVFSYSFSNLITTFKTSLCLIICLLALVLGTASAQPNSFAPGPAGNKDQQAGDKGAQGVFTPEQLAELQDAKNVWKTEMMNENSEEINKMFVNTDSIYRVFSSVRKASFVDGNKYTYKVYPCAIFNKIAGLDTALAACIHPVNKHYFKMIIDPDKMTTASEQNLKLIDDIALSYKFKTVDVFNNILPPLMLQDNKTLKPADYQKMLNQFFGSNPELINYCSKKFVNMLEHHEYEKLMKLHRLSANVVDMRTSGKEDEKPKSNK